MERAAAPAPAPPALRQQPSLHIVKAIFILDSFGQRLLAKYYDDTFPSVKDQKSFERNVFNKTHKTDSEIAFLEGLTIVYKSSIDLFFYVVGSPHENELMLTSVLTCLFESLSHMLRKNVEKRTLVDNMDGAFLVVDETVDGGVILEIDPQQVIQKLNFRMLPEPAAYGFVLFDYITGGNKKIFLNEAPGKLQSLRGTSGVTQHQAASPAITNYQPPLLLHPASYQSCEKAVQGWPLWFTVRVDDTTLSEHSVTQVLQSAKEQIKWSLLK